MPLAEHDVRAYSSAVSKEVSIHVPLAEHDHRSKPRGSPSSVSIHVPLAEHDLQTLKNNADNSGFNSRAPRGARRITQYHSKRFNSFNSRAPRGARPGYHSSSPNSGKFQFTCPSRSTTALKALKALKALVSIHVPLAEHDARTGSTARPLSSFNSRAPRGARPPMCRQLCARSAFQFTCPSRSTTVYFGGYNNSFLVSIHVPLAEHDFPTSDQLYDFLVSIHVPLAEHDRAAR